MAERGRFELPVPVKVRPLSRRGRSTTLPHLRNHDYPIRAGRVHFSPTGALRRLTSPVVRDTMPCGPRVHQPMNRYLLRSTIVAALGGLLFGFDTVVISGATSTLSEVYHLTPMLLGFTVASALLGTVLGSMFAAAPSDRYGRRQCLQALAGLYVITALGCALAWNWYAFVWFRFVGGLAIGGSSVIGPMYIAEIAPAAKRGRLVGLFQFNIVAGILIAYLSNYAIGTLGFGAEEWRWKLGVATLPALFFFLNLFGIPQSPRWLIRRGFVGEARQIFARIGEPDPDAEVADVARSVQTEDRTRVEPLFQHKYRRPILLAIAIGFFNQMSGINAILYYLNDIFK